jgi:hypothetical protein
MVYVIILERVKGDKYAGQRVKEVVEMGREGVPA